MADRLYKDIRFFYMSKGHQLGPFDILQDFSVTTVGDLKMYYNVTKNMYGDDFIVFVDGSEEALAEDRYPSLTLSVDDEGFAVFRWLERSNVTIIDCMDNLKELVLGAVKVAKDLGYTKFALVDDSCVGSSIYSYKYSLAELHFVCYGRTFYESFLDVTVQNSSKEGMSLYRYWMSDATWSAVAKALIKSEEGLDFDFDLDGIDVDKPGSCMAVLARVYELNNDSSTIFFTKYLVRIHLILSVRLFHNSTWLLDV